MKKQLLSIAGLAFLLCGCAHVTTVEETYNPDTQGYDRTRFSGTFWFNKGAVEGLQVGQRSGKESTTLKVSKGTTETQTEAIRALGEALGAGIATGAKKAIIP
jgi:hypothetical protein